MRWAEQVETTTGVEAWDGTEMDLVLDLVRDVAHGVERRYGPLTAYAVGVAIGQRLGEDAGGASARHDTLRAMAQALSDAAAQTHPED